MEPPRTVEGIELVFFGETARRSSIGLMARRSRKYRIGLSRPCTYNLWNGGKKGVDLSQKIGDWSVHIFREHNKEADLWAGFGPKGISMECNDESAIDWTKVTGICGFWDGSCK